MGNYIYVIMGSTGEYSDFNEWSVGWCNERKEAEEKTAFLNSFCEELGISTFKGCRKNKLNEAREIMFQYDPFCNIDNLTGVVYYFIEVKKMKELKKQPDDMAPSSSKKNDKLTLYEDSFLVGSNLCPDCKGHIKEGPSGGGSQNVTCQQCGAGFNIMSPFSSERITDKFVVRKEIK